MLRAWVDDRGRATIQSVYIGSDWIFHEAMAVRVGERILESVKVPSYDPDNDSKAGGSLVVEAVAYRDGRDRGIFDAIATAGDAPVRVRLIGRQRQRDFVLTPGDRAAIRDVSELATLLRVSP
jgi:hypothetical protein